MSPDPTFDPHEAVAWDPSPQRSYALSGKIMLSAIVILFVVVLFMVVLHIYARWYLLRARRRHLLRRLSQQRRRHHQRTHLVFYVDNHQPSSAAGGGGGLEASVLGKLPVFVFSSRTSPEPIECAVCLSEFEENEEGRVLPKCKHSFHIGCIDMWFLSHSTCPLCRSPVEPPVETQQEISIPVSIAEPEECGQPSTGLSSETCAMCQHEEAQGSSTSVAAPRKGLDMVAVRIELPRRSESEFELIPSSPASQGYRSPGTRLLSFKRILSMNKRIGCGGGAGSTGAGASTPTAVTELDLEKGNGESTQERAQHTF